MIHNIIITHIGDCCGMRWAAHGQSLPYNHKLETAITSKIIVSGKMFLHHRFKHKKTNYFKKKF